jgi:hypothetical protein
MSHNYIDKIFVLKKRTNWFLALFLVPFSIIAVSLATFTTYGQIGSYFLNNKILFPNYYPELWILALGLWLIAFIAINIFLWQIIGKERLSFLEDRIELLRGNGLIKRPIKINYFEIESFETDGDNGTPYWIKHWGLGGGKIIIIKVPNNIRFGQDLTESESDSYKNTFNEELKKRKE